MSTETTKAILAVGGVALIAATLLLLFFKEAPQSNAQILAGLIGYAAGWVSAVYAFFFGSSNGSQAKDKTIETLASSKEKAS